MIVMPTLDDINSTVFLDVMPCRPVEMYWSFVGDTAPIFRVGE
jgi:hypothetical protein